MYTHCKHCKAVIAACYRECSKCNPDRAAKKMWSLSAKEQSEIVIQFPPEYQ